MLLVAPAGRDAAQAKRILESVGMATETCADVLALCDELARGAGAAIVAEEALSPPATEMLGEHLARQPAWSDIPIVVVAGARSIAGSGELLAAHLSTLGNVTLLSRPLRMIALVSAVRGALRARHRQYELRALIEQREAEVRQRDQFLAMLGHELRNPLAAITLASEMMDRQELDAFTRERAMITRQTRHLARLVDDLLDVARVTSGKVMLKKRPVLFTDVVRKALQVMSSAAREHLIEVNIEEGAELVVDGDPVRLEQVTTNLLTNAFKYTPPGGTITVRVTREGSNAVLSVRDTGVGLAEPMLSRVFEMFVQADHTLDRSRGGMGLGLTLVRNIVELHGGSVEAHSEGPGQGAEFVVRLPIDEVNSPEQSTFAFRRPPGPSRRLVIIEDNEDLREALTLGLEDAGHEVQSAADGPSGLALLLEARPEVAFVDVGLPGLDGYAVAREARQKLGTRTRLIALTGYGQPEDRRRALEAGFDLHLTKPLDFARLQELLHDEAPEHAA